MLSDEQPIEADSLVLLTAAAAPIMAVLTMGFFDSHLLKRLSELLFDVPDVEHVLAGAFYLAQPHIEDFLHASADDIEAAAY